MKLLKMVLSYEHLNEMLGALPFRNHRTGQQMGGPCQGGTLNLGFHHIRECHFYMHDTFSCTVVLVIPYSPHKQEYENDSLESTLFCNAHR